MSDKLNELEKILIAKPIDIKIVFPHGNDKVIQDAAYKMVKSTRIVPILLFNKLSEIPVRRHKKVKYIAIEQIKVQKHVAEIKKFFNVNTSLELEKILISTTGFAMFLLLINKANKVIINEKSNDKKVISKLKNTSNKDICMIKDATTNNIVELSYITTISLLKEK